MDWQIVATLGVTAVAVVLFVTEKIRMDAVAVLVLAALVVLGQIDGKEALSGFSNSATITVAAMFVLAAGLQKSGALDSLGRLLGKVKSPLGFLLLMFAVVSLISPFVNNTPVVAVFIPLVIATAQKMKLAPSKALIPLSFVSQMAGACTLIGTSTNLLVDAMARQQGFAGFSMFGFAPFGLILMAAGWVYLLMAGRWLLPDNVRDLDEQQSMGKYVAELRVSKDSPLIGQTANAVSLGGEWNVYVVGLLRDGERLSTPRDQVLKAQDLLLVRGEAKDIRALRDKFALRHFSLNHHFKRIRDEETDEPELVLTEVMIAPNSKWIGANIAALNQSWHRDCLVLGIQRRSQTVRERLRRINFRVGDILLMTLPKEDLGSLRRDKDFVLLSAADAKPEGSWRSWFALAVMTAVVVCSAVGWVPIAVAALLGAVLMVGARCLSAQDAYDSIDWRIIVLLAGLLPLGLAMTNSGAAQFIVDNTLGKVSGYGPLVVLGVLYLLTMVLTELMSNAGTAVLMTPIAMTTATMLGIEPTPFLIAVMFAASTSFMTPVGYQTNTMVYAAGGYKFGDFLKIGLPLNVLFWVLAMILIPLIWPFVPAGQ